MQELKQKPQKHHCLCVFKTKTEKTPLPVCI